MEKTNEFVYVDRQTTERFKNRLENRLVNQVHLSRIKEQMLESPTLFPPITVNKKTNNIIDGQHRLEAFQKLVDSNQLSKDSKLSVMYVEIDEKEEQGAIVAANTNTKNWSLDDFINSYKKTNAEYRKLEDWGRNHQLTYDGKKVRYRYAAAILKQENCSNLLRTGNFFVSDEDLKNGEIIHNEMVEILTVLDKPTNGSSIEAMAIAWSEVRHIHTLKEWLKEMKYKKNVLAKKPFANKKDWTDIFSIVSTAINIKK